MPAAPPVPVPRAAAAALAAVVVVGLAPARAAAACGDYVHVAGKPTADHPPPAPNPCDGPACSGHPAAPQPVSTAPAGDTSRGHEWAATTPAEPTPAGGRSRLAPRAAAGAPLGVPQPIFHPPRGR